VVASSAGAEPQRSVEPELYKVTSGETWKEAGPAVVFTADDGYGGSNGTLAYMSYLDSKGVKGTFFWSVGWTPEIGLYDPDRYPHGTGPGADGRSPCAAQNIPNAGIPLDDVLEIARQGHELGTHGWCHEPYVDYLASNGPQGLERLLRDAQHEIYRQLEAHPETGVTPVTPTVGAYPTGQQNEEVRLVVSRMHDFYRGSLCCIATNPDPFRVEMFDLAVLDPNITNGDLLDRGKALVQEAAYNRALLVFLVHSPGHRDAVAGGNFLSEVVGPLIDYIRNTGQIEQDVRTRYDNSFRLWHDIPIQAFGEAMLARTAKRGAASMEDTSGHAYFSKLRTQQLEVIRNDQWGDRFWFDYDEASNTAFYDSTTQGNFEFRKGVTVNGPFVTNAPYATFNNRYSFFRGGDYTQGVPAFGVQLDMPSDLEPGYQPVFVAYNNRSEEIFSLRNNGTMSLGGVGNIQMGQAALIHGGRTLSSPGNVALQSDQANVHLMPAGAVVVQNSQGGGILKILTDGSIEYRDEANVLRWRIRDGNIELFRPGDGVQTAGITALGQLQMTDTALGILRTATLQNGQLVWQ